jgi:hypothetical protein
MSQQQINRISAKNYIEKSQNTLKKQADLFYLEEHFKINSKYDKQKFLYSQLYSDILCTDDCEVLNWIDKKIRGALESSDIEIVDLKSLQTNKRDITINNYYNQDWKTIDW